MKLILFLSPSETFQTFSRSSRKACAVEMSDCLAVCCRCQTGGGSARLDASVRAHLRFPKAEQGLLFKGADFYFPLQM